MRRFTLGLLASAGAMLLPGAAFADGEGEIFERLDANKDGQLTADEAGDRRRIFERLLKSGDKNKDGKLSKEEFIAASKEAPKDEEPRREEPRRPDAPRREEPRRPDAPREGERKPDPERIAAEFDRMDANKDGKITEEELPEGARARFGQMRERFDKDNDKAISKEEFIKGVSAGDRRPDGGGPGEIFAKLDANKDGKISEDEIPADKKEQFKQMIARLDVKPEGGITREQFIRLTTLVQGGERRPEPRPEGAPIMRDQPFGPIMAALDVDKDGKLSASEIADAPKHLAELDKNKDGSLSQDELRPNFARFGGGEGNPAQAMLQRIKSADANGDGKISKEEAPDRVKENFGRFDANGDGFIDEAELRRFAENLGARPDAPRREGDRPRDGDRKPEERKVEGDRPRDGERKPERKTEERKPERKEERKPE